MIGYYLIVKLKLELNTNPSALCFEIRMYGNLQHHCDKASSKNYI